MNTSTHTFYEQTIINNIDFEAYGLDNDMYLYDKIITTYNIFKSEYVHENNKHIQDARLFKEWLQGLPSVLTVPFYNFEILENARKGGFVLDTEFKEDEFLERYWIRLAQAFFTLKDNL